MTTTPLSRSTTASPGESARAPTAIRRARRRRRWIGRAIWAVIAVAGVVGLVFAWRPKPVAVDTVTIGRGDLVVTVNEVARTRVRDRYVIAAPLGGYLSRIELRPGDAVKSDGVLARISPMAAPLLDPRTRAEALSRSEAGRAGELQAQAAIARAELATAHARDELERARRLTASGSVPPDALTHAELEARLRAEELASARFAARIATHEAEMARAALARFGPGRSEDGFDVPAPVSGTVLRVLAQSAGPIQPGTPLLEIGDPSALEIVTEVLSADAVRISAGAKVTVERWGGPPLLAHVRRVEPSGFTRISALGVEEQRVPVIVDLDEPRERWAALGDGFRVETRILVEDKRAVLRAPIGAVFRHASRWAVFAVVEGRAHLVPVTLGSKSDAEVEITAGLAERDVVTVHPGEKVKEGSKLTSR